MSDTPNPLDQAPPAPKPVAKPSKSYFRSSVPGLSVLTGEGDVSPEREQFEPYKEKWQGEDIAVGYLATRNPVVIAKLKNDSSVDEISKEEFDRYTKGEKAFRLPRK